MLHTVLARRQGKVTKGERAWWLGAGALLLTACPSSVPVPAAAPEARRPGELVDIGGRALHAECDGQGDPVVVLEAGAGEDGSAWQQVLPELRRTTTTCVYDRAGTGLSPAAPRPHTLPQMVAELHALLERLVPGRELVLVGHSLGGLIVRLYVSVYPDRVRGLVLVDPTTEEEDLRMWGLLPRDLVATFREGRSAGLRRRISAPESRDSVPQPRR